LSRVDDAERFFVERYSCSQAVFAAFAPSFGIETSDALRLASALGGGLRAGSTCGAVLGALLTLGLARCDEACTSKSRHDVMDAVDTFHSRFLDRVGSLDCTGILGYDVRIPEEREIVHEHGLRDSVCLPAVRMAAEILEELLVDNDTSRRTP
jgi:C_GCAxxG_C_C family probable redox protein